MKNVNEEELKEIPETTKGVDEPTATERPKRGRKTKAEAETDTSSGKSAAELLDELLKKQIKREITVRLTFTSEVLGTTSSNPAIQEEFISSKAPDAITREEEIAAIGVDAAVDKSMTIFPKDDNGIPIIWAYQIKGFFKEACSMLRKTPGSKCSGITAFKKIIDGNIFIYAPGYKNDPAKGSKIRVDLHGGKIGSCQRPLRAQTAQGERISLANSETIPAGSTIEFTVGLADPSHMGFIMECFAYGRYKGLLQWRNSGKGAFECEVIDDRMM